MPLPQVSDRIKELPGQALRAVFAGVGQLLLAADKVRAQLATSEDEPAQPPATQASPSAAPPAAAAPAADSGDSRWRSLDKTGNVRLLRDGDEDLTKAASTPPPAAAEAATEAAPATPAAAEPEPAEPVCAEPAATEPATGATAAEPAAAAQPAAEVALPVANYDQLTVASLRARLRMLDVTQVQTLLDYEKAHQGRTDVVTMFERRIVKLEQGG